MTTKDKLLHFAAQFEQLDREIQALSKDAKDISFAASHELGVIMCHVGIVSSKLTKLASKL